MGQTASVGSAHLCCRPAVAADSSPISAGRIEEALPTLLSTPTATANAQLGNDGEKKAFQATANENEEVVSKSIVVAEAFEELSQHSGEGPNRASSKTPWTSAQQVDDAVAESQALDGPNRASGPSPGQARGSDEAVAAAGAQQEMAGPEEAAAPAGETQPSQPKRSREERKELRRQQRANAKERLRPFLTKNGFAGPNTPRRRFFRTQFPIHAAVSQNNAEVVKLLIIAGVDITKADSSSRTAQELARREHSRHNSHAQVLALLTEAQRRRAARLARRNQAAEALAGMSGEVSVGNYATSSTLATTSTLETARS